MSEMELRRHFKEWRKRNGKTLREVEALTGLSNAFICQFEKGKAGIGFDNGNKLLELLIGKPEDRHP